MKKLMQDNRFKCCEKCLHHETVCGECEEINAAYNESMRPDNIITGQITSITIGGNPIEFNGTITHARGEPPLSIDSNEFKPLTRWSGTIKLSKKKSKRLAKYLRASKKHRIPRKQKKALKRKFLRGKTCRKDSFTYFHLNTYLKVIAATGMAKTMVKQALT